MDDEIKVTIFIPRKAIKEKGISNCSVELDFCDGKLCQATMIDWQCMEHLYFDDSKEENVK